MKPLLKLIMLALILCTTLYFAKCHHTSKPLISSFPLTHYDQTIATWINPSSPDFQKALISQDMQKQRMNIFLDHYFGDHSPWNMNHVNHIIQQTYPDDLQTIEKDITVFFNNKNKNKNEIGYGENYQPYTQIWIDDITNNIHLEQFSHLTYQANQRGIAVANLYARTLPTDDPHFYSHTLAGQGYPFDNLQISALWLGTPVYILGETRDHEWLLVLTPEYIGWVKSHGIARVDAAFVNRWTKAAKTKLAAITKTKTSLVDTQKQFISLSFVGSVFPASRSANNIQLMVPASDTNHHAIIKQTVVSPNEAVIMPLTLTPENVSIIMSTLIGRSYGWGGSYFYNDCSAELKNLFTPFGIWLSRHSAEQLTAGNIIDLSAYSLNNRLSFLIKKGKPFLTLIYIGGHIMLYVGHHPNPQNPSSSMAMTYQDMWGLRPETNDRRAVIGKSVLFPLLPNYPEDTSLMSQAARKEFVISYLTDLPDLHNTTPSRNIFTLKSLMYPELLFN